MTQIFILLVFLSWSNSLVLHCFSLSVFLFLLFDVDNGGGGSFFQLCCCCLSSAMIYSLGLSLEVSDQVRAGTAPSWERGGCPVCRSTIMIDTSQILPLALISCVDSGALDSCKSNFIYIYVFFSQG